MSMLEEKTKFEVDFSRNERLIEGLEQEIKLLEKDNDNLHRKLTSTLNSVLF